MTYDLPEKFRVEICVSLDQVEEPGKPHTSSLSLKGRDAQGPESQLYVNFMFSSVHSESETVGSSLSEDFLF